MKFKGLSDNDIEKMASSQDPVIKRAGEILRVISSDLELRMFSSITNIVETICDDMDSAATSMMIFSPPEDGDIPGLINWRDNTLFLTGRRTILGSNKDDKLFDRINVFMKNYSDYVKAIALGTARLEKLGLSEKEEGTTTDFFSKKAKEVGRRNNKQG